MALNRGRLANIDRRLLAELEDEEEWQPVRIRVSAAMWSTWKRYCDVVGLSMGKAIVAMIETELATVVDADVETTSAVIAERERLLDEREENLDRRAEELDRRERRWGPPPTRRDLERMADQIEPPDPGWITSPTFDIEMFKGVGRNQPCPCGSGRKFKVCHWDEHRQRS